jgi:hypothetical protein
MLSLANKEFFLELEFAHLFLFMVAIGIVLQASYLLKVLSLVLDSWEMYGLKGIGAAKQQCAQAIDDPKYKDSIGYIQHYFMRERFAFFIIKYHFLTSNMLPMDFDFVSYLEKSIIICIIDTVHIDSFYWGCIAVCLWLNWTRSYVIDILMGDPHPGGLPGGLLPFGLNLTDPNKTLAVHYAMDKDSRALYPHAGRVQQSNLIRIFLLYP